MDFQITYLNGDLYYHLFYAIAAIVSVIMFLWIGIKRKYPLHDWILISLSGVVFMTIGLRMGTFSYADWKLLFSFSEMPIVVSKTSIGGLVGFLLGIWIAINALKKNYPVLDVYAFIIPVVLIFQRIGCLVTGCCFGTPTQTNFGVQYADHYPIFTHHFLEGYVPKEAALSLPVHPVPIYFIIGAFLTLILVIKYQDYFKQKGSLFLFSILMIMGSRMIIEFFRDPITNHQLGDTFGGLKSIQWILLAMCILMLTILIIRERTTLRSKSISISKSLVPHVTISALLAIIIIPFVGMLDQIELANIFFHFILFSGLIIVVAYKQKSLRQPSLSPFILVIFAIFWMGQTETLYESKYEHFQEHNKKQRNGPITIAKFDSHLLGGSFGSVNGTQQEFKGSGCDRELIRTNEFSSKYSMGYFYENSHIKDNGKINTVGIGLSYTHITKKSFDPTNILIGTQNIAGISGIGVIGNDYHGFGYRLGLLAGDIYNLHGDRQPSDTYNTIQQTSFLPVVQFRFGSRNGLHMIGGVADDYQFGIYRYLGRAVIGYDFSNNPKTKYVLRAGLDLERQFCIEGEFSLSNQFSILPTAYFLENPILGISVRYSPSNDYNP